MSEALSVENSNIGPLNLVSTPIAIMANYGLSTYVGLSSDDPANIRNKDVEFLLILSAFGNSALIGRAIIGQLKPHEHRFFSVDAELKKLGWDKEAKLCVIHRVPSNYLVNGEIRYIQKETKPDYSMYRAVVQYGVPGGGMGGVIYETPPNFNLAGRKPHFLSFSNKLYLSNQVDNYLVFLNYSVSPEYSQAAEVKLHFYNAQGNQVAQKLIQVKPFDYFCLKVKDVLKGQRNSEQFLSFNASSISSALIPLSILVDRSCGGVSVEHSHPPQEYLMADWPVVSEIKLRAAKSLFES